MANLYVQYGCGWTTPEGWAHFDASPALRWERVPVLGSLWTKNAKRFPKTARYGDIVKGLPVAMGSCAGIYCSHVLEHLALADVDRALANTYGYLREEGTFRFVMPDLEQLARVYIADSDPGAAHRFMKGCLLGKERRPRGFIEFLIQWAGNSSHLWMWDEKAMTEELTRHGFRNVRRAQFGDAEDRRFREVEEKARFDGCLAMQCRK
ncbi:MAG: class I SAM-dependent methyltransferase [Limisphaerales bacterium]